MSRENNNMPYVFLVELSLSFLIFIVAAVTCVGLLIIANKLSEESANLTNGVYQAQTIVEKWQHNDLELNNNTYTLHFDKNWNLSENTNDIILILKEEDLGLDLMSCEVNVFYSDKLIYTLNAKKFNGEVVYE